MQELNRDILINGIQGLPHRKAPEGLWHAIENDLPAYPVQDLPVHTAPAEAWEGVVSMLDRKWSRKRILWWMVPFLIIFMGSAVVYNSFVEKESQVTGGRLQENVKMTEPGVVSEEPEQEKPDEEKELLMAVATREKEQPEKDLAAFQQPDRKDDLKASVYEIPPASWTVNPMKSLFIKNLAEKNSSEILSGNEIPFEEESPGPSWNDIHLDCNFNAPDQSIYTGLSLEYQQFLKGRKWEGTRLRSWLSVDATIGYRIDRFVAESGLGVAFSGDLTKIDYSYRQYELVDTYVYVDSIHIDPITGVVQYYTTTVNVYDSVDHISEAEIKTRYKYVQIPLMLGYEVIRADRWMLDVKAGGAFIAQISRKDKNAMPGHGEARIIVNDPFMQYRKKNFFRLTGSARFFWWLDKNLRCFAEQSIHYYPKPFYSGQKPVSTGVRVGVIYNF